MSRLYPLLAGLIPLQLLCAPLVRAAAEPAPSAGTYAQAGTGRSASPGPGSAPVRSEAWTRTLQSGSGLLGGVALGSLVVLGVSQISCYDPDNPDADTFGCHMGKGMLALGGGSAAYVLGTSLGIYASGRLMDRRGWYLAALGGAAGGFAAGYYLANSLDLETTPTVLLTLGMSNLLSLGLYGWTDRVDARLGYDPPPMRSEGLPGGLSARSLRAETRVILWRL